jgi:hypothetical protein
MRKRGPARLHETLLAVDRLEGRRAGRGLRGRCPNTGVVD